MVLSGRPVASFFQAPFRPMLKALAKLLVSVGSPGVAGTFRHWGRLSAPHCLKTIRGGACLNPATSLYSKLAHAAVPSFQSSKAEQEKFGLVTSRTYSLPLFRCKPSSSAFWPTNKSRALQWARLYLQVPHGCFHFWTIVVPNLLSDGFQTSPFGLYALRG